MSRFLFGLLVFLGAYADLCLGEVVVATNAPNFKESKRTLGPRVELSSEMRGWDYLIEKLKNDGINDKTLKKVYLDPRMPPFIEVSFSLQPKESHQMYSGFRSKALIKQAKGFLSQHKSLFDQAEKKYKVNRYVIASILLVETRFGKNTGKEIVLNRLSRVGSIAKPKNVDANFTRLLKIDPSTKFEEVKARAEYLEEKFYPEILALFEIAQRNNLDPLGIKGSHAGAFGIPQFLPSTYLKYGVDANKDGKVSLYSTPDAILSTANFLAQHGWHNDGNQDDKAFVIWNYNQSDPYVDAVLGVASELSAGR